MYVWYPEPFSFQDAIGNNVSYKVLGISNIQNPHFGDFALYCGRKRDTSTIRDAQAPSSTCDVLSLKALCVLNHIFVIN